MRQLSRNVECCSNEWKFSSVKHSLFLVCVHMWFRCMFVCMCSYRYECDVCLYVNPGACAHVWRPCSEFRCLSQLRFTLRFWRQPLTELTTQLSWLTGKPQGFACPCLPEPCQKHMPPLWLFTGLLGLELRAPCTSTASTSPTEPSPQRLPYPVHKNR